MQTAADAACNAVSFNVLKPAQGLISKHSASIAIQWLWLNGKPDTALTAATPVQTLDGGTLTRLSDTSLQLNWTTGQSVHVADRGPYPDSSVTLGSATGGV